MQDKLSEVSDSSPAPVLRTKIYEKFNIRELEVIPDHGHKVNEAESNHTSLMLSSHKQASTFSPYSFDKKRTVMKEIFIEDNRNNFHDPPTALIALPNIEDSNESDEKDVKASVEKKGKKQRKLEKRPLEASLTKMQPLGR